MTSSFMKFSTVFVDDLASIPTSQKLKEEVEALYAKDLESRRRKPDDNVSGPGG